MTDNRATCWSVTINNPTAQDDEAIALARQAGWTVDGQLERGEQGTQHYQLCVKTPQVRFSALKKRFHKAHIEVARNRSALDAYVSKEATRLAKLVDSTEQYPSLSKFWTLITERLNDESKDGLDCDELAFGRVKFYTDANQKLWKAKPLHYLDYATRMLIRDGYHVEGIGANPNTRSQWNLFGEQIILRSVDALNKRVIKHNQDADDDKTTLRQGEASELPQTSGDEATTPPGSEHGDSEGSIGNSGQDDN